MTQAQSQNSSSKNTKFIFVTGGVVSSLGKGLSSASLASLLQARGYSVRLRKLDPYLNVDPGTMNPTQHGEVFVTDDGSETDLDLGHYERFTDVSARKGDNITTGRIYSTIIERERRGDYLGGTVQVIPHVTNIIKNFITSNVDDVDFVLAEIGGTIGDIEGQPFIESLRQLSFELGHDRCAFVHLTFLPWINAAKELKTKPTQHSVAHLRSMGINPDIVLCRCDREIPEDHLVKISKLCSIPRKNVISALDAKSIYEVPINFAKEELEKRVLEHFNLECEGKTDTSKWQKVCDTVFSPKGEVKIGIVGKYITCQDSYKSLDEAIVHGAMAHGYKAKLVWIDARDLEEDESSLKVLDNLEGVIVPGGFGKSGTEGKINAIRYARENKIPYLGICLGMQMATIEFARNVAGVKDACSSEFCDHTNPLVGLITEWDKNGKIEKRVKGGDLGGTMRLGAYECKVKKDSQIHKAYGSDTISERHRHRYEVSMEQAGELEKAGLVISGTSPDGTLPETIELPENEHPFFVGVQFHPEFKSRPFSPSPIFKAFVGACL